MCTEQVACAGAGGAEHPVQSRVLNPTSKAPSWEGLTGYDVCSDEIRACGFDCRLYVTITDTLLI